MKKVIFFDWDGTIASTKASEFANIQRTKLFEKNVNDKELINYK
jgi:FMN phosphatase YigB (HAD superfamily)